MQTGKFILEYTTHELFDQSIEKEFTFLELGIKDHMTDEEVAEILDERLSIWVKETMKLELINDEDIVNSRFNLN